MSSDNRPESAQIPRQGATTGLTEWQHAERELLSANEMLERRGQELQQQREWFQVALASIGDAVITCDAQGRITFLNPVAEALTGWLLGEACGRPIGQVFRVVNEQTRAEAESPVARVLQTGTKIGPADHNALITRSGVAMSIEDSAAPIRDSSGAMTGVVVVFHDVTKRRRIEIALAASEERFHGIFNQAAVGIVIADMNYRYVEANQRFCDLLGYTSEELRQLTVMDVTHPDDRLRTDEQVAGLRSGKRSRYTHEKRYLRKNGSSVWCRTTVAVLKATGEGPQHFLAIIDDISDWREAEEARSRLAAVVESTDDAVVTKTLAGIITTWNRGAQRLFGYEAQEVIGKPVTLLIPPDRIDEEPCILEKLRRGERIEPYETVRMRKDGTRFDVSLTVSPIVNAQGEVIGASKIAREISRAKQVENALREETRVLELMNATGSAIAAQLDVRAVIQTVTDAATELSGAQFGVFFYNRVDQSGELLLHYALAGAPHEDFERLGLPRNTPVFNPTFQGEGAVRSADITRDPRYGTMAPHHGMPKGHPPVRSYLAVPVILRSGEVIGGLFFGHSKPDVFTQRAERLVVGVAAQASVAIDNARLYESAQEEIARRESAEAALRATDRRKDDFLATLAHELRNPLAPIRQAALISKSIHSTEAQKHWSHDVIDRQVGHMALLLDDLLDISRVTRGVLNLRVEMTDLATVIDSAVETARPVVSAKQHQLTIELPPGPVRFAGDPLRLAQIFSNLLTNAAKYTPAQGRIRLRATCDETQITVSVTDTGIGIPVESLAGLFTMFSQVNAGHQGEGGLGIGLALARGLVELHGGTIEARSAGVGQGSEFIVRLPRRSLADAADGAVPSPSTGPPGHPRRVVVVADDNVDAAESLAVLLRLEGHVVHVVHDGRSAVDVILAERPDCALLDIGMPGLNGYDVARQVRHSPLGNQVLLIAVTGWGQDRDKAEAAAAGFNQHFTKPLDPTRVLDMLNALPVADGGASP